MTHPTYNTHNKLSRPNAATDPTDYSRHDLQNRLADLYAEKTIACDKAERIKADATEAKTRASELNAQYNQAQRNIKEIDRDISGTKARYGGSFVSFLMTEIAAHIGHEKAEQLREQATEKRKVFFERCQARNSFDSTHTYNE